MDFYRIKYDLFIILKNNCDVVILMVNEVIVIFYNIYLKLYK